MARNDERRRRLLDAAIGVLAEQGGRGLTHRAVDAAARVPAGTTSNYFRSRAVLVAGLLERIGQRLQPTPESLQRLSGRPASRGLFAEYIRDIVGRLSANRVVTVALFELRLESTRNPEIATRLGDWLRSGFAADVAFNASARLPGGPRDIALFHYAINGLLLDRITQPVDPGTAVDDVIDVLVDRLLPPLRPRPRSKRHGPRGSPGVGSQSTRRA